MSRIGGSVSPLDRAAVILSGVKRSETKSKNPENYLEVGCGSLDFATHRSG